LAGWLGPDGWKELLLQAIDVHGGGGRPEDALGFLRRELQWAAARAGLKAEDVINREYEALVCGKNVGESHGKGDRQSERDVHSYYDLPESVSPDAYMTPRDMAKVFNVPYEPLKKRLERFRKSNWDGWIQNSNRRRNEAGYTFQVSVVLPIIDEMRQRASRELSHERPAR